MYYLNHNITTPLRPEVVAAMAIALAQLNNPSLLSMKGKIGNQLVKGAQVAVSSLVGADPEWVIFTSGRTEANDLIVPSQANWRLLATESILSKISKISEVPKVEIIPVNAQGIINLSSLEYLLSVDSRPAVVALLLADDITGIIQPVSRIATIVRVYGGLLHCDATQATGKIVIDLGTLSVDSLTIAAHQLGGPQKVGALIICPTSQINFFSSLKLHYKTSIRDITGIVGFGSASILSMTDLPVMMTRLLHWRSIIEAGIHTITPNVIIIGEGVERLPNTISVAIPETKGSLLALPLDTEGIEIVYRGSNSADQSALFRLLLAMGCTSSTIVTHISLGWTNCQEDIASFLRGWKTMSSRFYTMT